MEEQFAVSGIALAYTVMAPVSLWVAVVTDGWVRALNFGVAAFVGLTAIRLIVEDAVNYLAVS